MPDGWVAMSVTYGLISPATFRFFSIDPGAINQSVLLSHLQAFYD